MLTVYIQGQSSTVFKSTRPAGRLKAHVFNSVNFALYIYIPYIVLPSAAQESEVRRKKQKILKAKISHQLSSIQHSEKKVEKKQNSDREMP